MDSKQKRELFESFLRENSVLIVDRVSSSRTRLARALSQFGARMDSIRLTHHFNQAKDIFKNDKPKLVISDYMIGGGSGFDLFKYYRANFDEAKNCVFVLVTATTSQAAVAKAAEEDVDAFILRPYTPQSLESSLIDAIINKLYPSEYMKSITAAKELLYGGNIDKAIQALKKAKEQSDNPSLACFYLGQAENMKEQVEGAKEQYQEGLSYNNIHYKCLSGLFKILLEQHRFNDAYELAQRLLKFYPANADRLSQIIRLAVQTGRFTDIENFFSSYQELNERSESLMKHICAGLIVAAKYYLEKKRNDSALKVLKMAAEATGGHARFLRLIVEALAHYSIYDQGSDFLNLFKAEDKDGSDYQIAHFLGKEAMQPEESVCVQGKELIQQGVKNPYIYKRLIELAAYFPAEDGSIKSLAQEATNLWPDKKHFFEHLC